MSSVSVAKPKGSWPKQGQFLLFFKKYATVRNVEITIKNCIRLTKSNGLFTFTCASKGRPEHGTNRTKPEDAPLLKEYEDWGDYYKNLEESDIREIFNPDEIFSSYGFEYNPKPCDLYFWGIKK